MLKEMLGWAVYMLFLSGSRERAGNCNIYHAILQTITTHCTAPISTVDPWPRFVWGNVYDGHGIVSMLSRNADMCAHGRKRVVLLLPRL
jgi:hypothetical protein